MAFLLSFDFIKNINELSEKYYTRIGVAAPEKATQPSSISTLFGAHDIKTRKQQIDFLQNLCRYLDARYDLQGQREIENSENMSFEEFLKIDNERLGALRTLVSACLFIQSQNSSGSILNKLISEAMGLGDSNALNDETLANCFKSTSVVLKDGSLFTAINEFLKKEEQSPLPMLLFEQWETYNKAQANTPQYSKFPITNIMVPLIAHPLGIGGAAMGAITAGLLTRSTALMRANYHVTAAFGGLMYLLLGPSAKLGAMVMAPVLAEEFVNWYLTIALAWLGGHLAGGLGNIIAYGIGLPLDCALKAATGTGHYICQRVYQEHFSNEPSGINLINGNIIIDGVRLCATKEEDLENLYSSENGKLLTPSAIQREAGYVSPPYLKELKEKIQSDTSPAYESLYAGSGI